METRQDKSLDNETPPARRLEAGNLRMRREREAIFRDRDHHPQITTVPTTVLVYVVQTFFEGNAEMTFT